MDLGKKENLGWGRFGVRILGPELSHRGKGLGFQGSHLGGQGLGPGRWGLKVIEHLFSGSIWVLGM